MKYIVFVFVAGGYVNRPYTLSSVRCSGAGSSCATRGCVRSSCIS